VFSTDVMLPAAGQGALGVETRAGRPDLAALLAPLADAGVWLTVAAERAVSRAMGGSCSMPVAAHATLQGRRLHLRAAWGDAEQPAAPLVRAEAEGDMPDTSASSHRAAEALGERVAAQLRAGGAH
jgi:hydroxymethylbilane synthase